MTELAVYQQDENVFLAPATNVHGALQRYQDMKDFVEKVLRNGSDYGVIPGTGTKPTLLKPGAEKLCAFFGLAVTYHIIEKELDWMGTQHGGEPFFFFNYGVKLLRSGRLAGEGEGSCNSWEKKYRYRKGERVCPKCGKPTIIQGKKEYGGGWLCFAKKGGCGAKFREGDQTIEGQSVEDIPNPDVADLVNTIQKMAQKRALIAATLNATNASDWFTQDIEDFVEGGFVEWEPEKIENPQPQSEEKKAPNSVQAEPQIIMDMKPETARALDSALKRDTPFTLTDACKVTSENGKSYGELTVAELSFRWNEEEKKLKKNGLTGEAKAEAELKRKAAKMIMDARKSGEIADK
jgi:ssDNA-binding Zn-finger/Zn-ribbon topoisomerase 1